MPQGAAENDLVGYERLPPFHDGARWFTTGTAHAEPRARRGAARRIVLGMAQTPWTRNPFARAAASRSAFSGRYSSESYQRLAASRLGNSRITGNVGFAPSTTSNFPPATRTRPLYF